MPVPDFAIVLSEGISKAGGLVDKLEVIDLLAEQQSKCTCIGFAGQNYNCPEHIAKTQCPNCKCIDIEKELHYEASMIDYSCTICGVFYQRRVSDGEYQFS